MNINGILLINKPTKITSNKIIQLIKLQIKINKIGYCGTLDPSATGLLITCIENTTKEIKILNKLDKTYIIIGTIGIISKTGDLDGIIFFYEKNKKKIKITKLRQELNYIKNNTQQKPQIFSSIKHNKIQLYKFARLDINLKIKTRNTTIYQLNILTLNEKIIILKIKCTYGTYMRSIIEEINQHIKEPICINKITRIKIGKYKIINSFNINKNIIKVF